MSSQETIRQGFGTVQENPVRLDEGTADEKAERVAALGGVPDNGPTALAEHSPVGFEGADVYDVRTSMENDLELYGGVIQRIRERVMLAEDLGDYATSEILRDRLEELEEDAEDIRSFLADDTLVLESADPLRG